MTRTRRLSECILNTYSSIPYFVVIISPLIDIHCTCIHLCKVYAMTIIILFYYWEKNYYCIIHYVYWKYYTYIYFLLPCLGSWRQARLAAAVLGPPSCSAICKNFSVVCLLLWHYYYYYSVVHVAISAAYKQLTCSHSCSLRLCFPW